MSDTQTFSQLPSRWRRFRANGGVGSAAIAFAFFVAVTAILMLRQDVIDYRPGQYVQHDITGRVDFDFPDADEFARMRDQARQQEPRVYRTASTDYWAAFADELLALPDQTGGRALDTATQRALDEYHGTLRPQYDEAVLGYVRNLRQQFTIGGAAPVILPADQRRQELSGQSAQYSFVRTVTLYPAASVNVIAGTHPTGADLPPEVMTQLTALAAPVRKELRPEVAQLAYAFLQGHPTHELDLAATQAAADRAAAAVLPTDAVEHYTHNAVIVSGGRLTDRDWHVLRAENEAFLAGEENAWIRQLGGTALIVLALTVLLGAYAKHYQPRIIRNHMRAAALAALMTAMLLITGLAGSGSSPLYFYGFGIAPTILTGIILVIAYDRRFAMGVGSIQAVLVGLAVNQGMGFFLILLVGLLVACFLLDDVRTRSKLIEVGGAAAVAMMVVTAATGLISLEGAQYVLESTLYAGASGLAAGFIALGILPFIERVFHITTSMTLLELADATHPLLKRLAFDAPGTYNHSMQVATLAEAAAEAIGANALACRVGAYYHDIGKVNKADYFVENQQPGGPSRHLNLSPNVSLSIILGHVRDGMELARQHHLPPTILQFIQQHHGTTLVEYFYKEACRLNDPSATEAVSETQYRYPGPKPKSRETAILMLCDCVESACRSVVQPNAASVEKLVNEMALRRLHDGQFGECDLTMRELELVKRSLVKTLMAIYHGRIAYPSESGGVPGAEAAIGTQRRLA